MLVKKATAAGIFLTVGLLISPASAQNRTYNNAYESITSLARSLSKIFDRLSEEDTKKYHGALFTALNNLDNGEIARWHSDSTGNYGTVEITATLPNGGQLCRKVYVEILTEKGKKNTEGWACMEGNGSWTFGYR